MAPVAKPSIKKRIARCRRVIVSVESHGSEKLGGKPTVKRRIARCRRILFPPPMNIANHSGPIASVGKVWHVENISHPKLSELITNFNVEYPQSKISIPEDDSLSVRGWALSSRDQQSRLHLVIRFASHTVSHPMNVDRGDVIEKVLTAKPENHPQIRCGFDYSVPMNDALRGFEVGFEVDGYIYTATEVFAKQ